MPIASPSPRSFVIVTPRPLWAWVGMMLVMTASLMLAAALLPYLDGVPDWLRFPLSLVVIFPGLVLGMRLGRREAVSWLADELVVQPLGWERHVRPARQIPREQVQSYQYEWSFGPRLRLRLQSGEKIVFGPGDYWRWNHRDEQTFATEALEWLAAAPVATAPRQELGFWERPAATLLVALLTAGVVGGTGWALRFGLAPGKSWGQLVPIYAAYLVTLLAWRRARLGKSVN